MQKLENAFSPAPESTVILPEESNGVDRPSGLILFGTKVLGLSSRGVRLLATVGPRHHSSHHALLRGQGLYYDTRSR